MNPDGSFYENMNQLVELLKKMLKDISSSHGPASFSMKSNPSAPTVNFYFVNFSGLPEDWEDLDEIEAFEEWQENGRDPRGHLNPSDLDFFRRNGIIF